MELGLIIKNTVIIGVILGLIFASQLPYFRGNHTTFNFPLLKKGEAYINSSFLAKGSDLFKNSPYANIGGEVTNKASALSSQVSTQVTNLQNNSLNSAKKFVAEKLLGAMGVKPEDLVQCKAN
jgi:hypothetical protein